MDRKIIHEDYHSKIRLQKRIVNSNNFTYRNTIVLAEKYFRSASEILDIGCGVGTIDFLLASKHKNITGIDISQNAIRAANLNSAILGTEKRTKFLVVDFPDQKIEGKYDGILISEVLEHLSEDRKAVRALRTLAKTGCFVIASSPSKNAPLFRLGLLSSFDQRVGHLRRYSLEEFRSLFETNGFKLIEVVKTEGILRNFLFTNDRAGSLIRFIKGPLSDFITLVDDFAIRLFGESNYYVVARKI